MNVQVKGVLYPDKCINYAKALLSDPELEIELFKNDFNMLSIEPKATLKSVIEIKEFVDQLQQEYEVLQDALNTLEGYDLWGHCTITIYEQKSVIFIEMKGEHFNIMEFE